MESYENLFPEKAIISPRQFPKSLKISLSHQNLQNLATTPPTTAAMPRPLNSAFTSLSNFRMSPTTSTPPCFTSFSASRSTSLMSPTSSSASTVRSMSANDNIFSTSSSSSLVSSHVSINNCAHVLGVNGGLPVSLSVGAQSLIGQTPQSTPRTSAVKKLQDQLSRSQTDLMMAAELGQTLVHRIKSLDDSLRDAEEEHLIAKQELQCEIEILRHEKEDILHRMSSLVSQKRSAKIEQLVIEESHQAEVKEAECTMGAALEICEELKHKLREAKRQVVENEAFKQRCVQDLEEQLAQQQSFVKIQMETVASLQKMVVSNVDPTTPLVTSPEQAKLASQISKVEKLNMKLLARLNEEMMSRNLIQQEMDEVILRQQEKVASMRKVINSFASGNSQERKQFFEEQALFDSIRTEFLCTPKHHRTVIKNLQNDIACLASNTIEPCSSMSLLLIEIAFSEQESREFIECQEMNELHAFPTFGDVVFDNSFSTENMCGWRELAWLEAYFHEQLMLEDYEERERDIVEQAQFGEYQLLLQLAGSDIHVLTLLSVVGRVLDSTKEDETGSHQLLRDVLSGIRSHRILFNPAAGCGLAAVSISLGTRCNQAISTTIVPTTARKSVFAKCLTSSFNTGPVAHRASMFALPQNLRSNYR